MKKHLIAAAVAAAVAVPAMAQNVSIYGVLDASLSSTDKVGTSEAVGSGSTMAQNSSLLSTARLGFKGEEDLGGGLKAGFVIESAIANDSEATFTIGGRGAEAYLTGSFGRANIGKAAGSDTNTVASGPTNLTNFAATTATRPDNRVQYTTPNFAGITANVAFATDAADDENETSATDKNNRLASFGGEYNQGPIRVLVFQARQDIKDASQSGKTKDTGLLARYDFGVLAAQLRYMNSKTSGTVTTAVDRKTTAVDLTAPVGNGITLGLGYIQIDNQAAASDAKKMSLYAVKDLSKRTNVYVAYATVDNDANSALGATGNTSTLQTYSGADQRMVGVGIRHSF